MRYGLPTPLVAGLVAGAALVAVALAAPACESAGGDAPGDDATAGAAADATGGVAADGRATDVAAPASPQRVSVADARARMLSPDHDPLLVCSYGSVAACESALLEGAIALAELEAIEDDLARDRELIFYCS